MESFSCRGRALERPESGGIRRDVASAVPYEASTETIRRAGGESPPLHRLSKRPSPHYVNHPRQKKKTGSPRRSFLLSMSSGVSLLSASTLSAAGRLLRRCYKLRPKGRSAAP